MKSILIIIGIILALIVGFFAYFGMFSKVICSVETQGGEILVYKQMTGDYSKSNKLMDETYYALLNEYGIETYKGFGIYYDNPKAVEKSKLRSEIGCIVEERDSLKLAQIKEGFMIKRCAKKPYIVTEFANKGKLSILIGVMRVYPEISKFVKEHGYKQVGFVMEIYDVPNKKIMYRKEIVD